MTRNDHREACAWAIMRCMNWENSTGKWIAAFAILDSLHGAGARVVPIEATEEMLDAAYYRGRADDFAEEREAWRAMSAAGDITNAPQNQSGITGDYAGDLTNPPGEK
jgi:hypothetical protein